MVWCGHVLGLGFEHHPHPPPCCLLLRFHRPLVVRTCVTLPVLGQPLEEEHSSTSGGVELFGMLLPAVETTSCTQALSTAPHARVMYAAWLRPGYASDGPAALLHGLDCWLSFPSCASSPHKTGDASCWCKSAMPSGVFTFVSLLALMGCGLSSGG